MDEDYGLTIKQIEHLNILCRFCDNFGGEICECYVSCDVLELLQEKKQDSFRTRFSAVVFWIQRSTCLLNGHHSSGNSSRDWRSIFKLDTLVHSRYSTIPPFTRNSMTLK